MRGVETGWERNGFGACTAFVTRALGFLSILPGSFNNEYCMNCFFSTSAPFPLSLYPLSRIHLRSRTRAVKPTRSLILE